MDGSVLVALGFARWEREGEVRMHLHPVWTGERNGTGLFSFVLSSTL